eukprot:1724687-Rhodomonas_salina.2
MERTFRVCGLNFEAGTRFTTRSPRYRGIPKIELLLHSGSFVVNLGTPGTFIIPFKKDNNLTIRKHCTAEALSCIQATRVPGYLRLVRTLEVQEKKFLRTGVPR